MWIFLTSDPFLWGIVWSCESLHQSYRGHLSSCPHTVDLIFPVPFLCLLVNWSRKLNQQKHCNLANIFADSTNTTGWLLRSVKPQWDARQKEKLCCWRRTGLLCSWGFYLFFFFNLCCLGVALLLCVWDYSVAVIWCKTFAMECVGPSPCCAYAFCLSCARNNVWPCEEPGESSNKWKLLLWKNPKLQIILV